jgi:hypothetical protein
VRAISATCARWLFVGMVVSAVAACSGGTAATHKPLAARSSSLRLDTASSAVEMQAALIGGPLRLVVKGDTLCTYAADDRVVWPNGFTASPDGTSVADATGRVVYRSGQRVYMGGGGAPPRGDDSPCGGSARVWLVGRVDGQPH